MKHIRVYWLTCVLIALFASVAANATTIIMPTDAQLIAKSPLIVKGTVLSTSPVDRDGRIWTETVVQVSQVLKGTAAETVTIREMGGVIGDRITKIFGGPEYEAGQSVLVFLTPTPRGDYQTMDLFVGKFTEEATLDGTRLWARHDESGDAVLLDASFQPIHAANVQRNATGFEQYVSDRVAGLKGDANYGIENPVIAEPMPAATSHGKASSEFTLISEPTVYRWKQFDNGTPAQWYSYGTQPGYTNGGVNEIQTAMASWTGYASAKIYYQYAGTTSTAGGMSSPNGKNEVMFNDPFSYIAGSYNPATGGTVGVGGFNGVSGQAQWTSPFTADSTHVQGTFTAWSIAEANLTIQDNVSPSTGISSTKLAEIVAHEFGHTLGLGHSSDSTALMYAYVTGIGPSLRADDQTAARWLYPNGSVQPPPTTTTAPNAPSGLTATVASSSSATLNWNDNSTNESGFYIFVSTNSGASYTNAGGVAANATGATVSGLNSGSTYYFYVVAYNSAGNSSASNVASATLGAATTTNPVSANFTFTPTVGIAGQTTFTFTDTSTGPVSSRTWQFGDSTTATTAVVSKVFTTSGNFTVYLTVYGSNGTQSTTSKTVQVTGSALVAAFSYSPSNPTTSNAISFSDQSTGGVTGWYWTFGDGTSSQAQNPSKQYTAAGTYNVTLTVYRNTEVQATSKQITVTAPVPVTPPVSAAFTLSPSAPQAGDSVSFTDASSGSPTSWSWTFGDGGSSQQQNPVHVFTAAGSYTVTLIASNAGSSSTSSRVIVVAPELTKHRAVRH